MRSTCGPGVGGCELISRRLVKGPKESLEDESELTAVALLLEGLHCLTS